jgi:hypothetical protein
MGTHVLSYELAYGPVPEGQDVHHTCNTSLCVNPKHLALVPHAKHIELTMADGLVARGEQAGNARLTWEIVRNIRQVRVERGLTTRKLAEMFHTSHSNVYAIVSNRTWRETSDRSNATV